MSNTEDKEIINFDIGHFHLSILWSGSRRTARNYLDLFLLCVVKMSLSIVSPLSSRLLLNVPLIYNSSWLLKRFNCGGLSVCELDDVALFAI